MGLIGGRTSIARYCASAAPMNDSAKTPVTKSLSIPSPFGLTARSEVSSFACNVLNLMEVPSCTAPGPNEETNRQLSSA
jgi:hypothetical protein